MLPFITRGLFNNILKLYRHCGIFWLFYFIIRIDQFHATAAIMVQRSIGVKSVNKTSLHFVCTPRQFIYRGTLRILSLKEVFMNLLVRTMIYGYIYPVDLEKMKDRVNIQP